jgi:glycosyltransferase involved in cell wall biosynthesis
MSPEAMAEAAATLVVPCYNEEQRLDGAALVGLVDARPRLNLLLVDDGSTDGTRRVLDDIASSRATRIRVLGLAQNGGKAEAVRRGLVEALAGPAALVGYFDADLSTPPGEVLRLLAVIEARGASVTMGSRVALLGTDIHRKPARHYLGRLFATAASTILGVRVYDTQCGAKVFRRTPALVAALETPFLSRWAFDVELLGRLLIGTPTAARVDAGSVVEMPLQAWRDVPGSKLKPAAMAGALKDLALIRADLARRRATTGGGHQQ